MGFSPLLQKGFHIGWLDVPKKDGGFFGILGRLDKALEDKRAGREDDSMRLQILAAFTNQRDVEKIRLGPEVGERGGNARVEVVPLQAERVIRRSASHDDAQVRRESET